MAAISLLFVLTAASFALVFVTDDTDGDGANFTVGSDTTGQIPISSAADLALIGTDHEDEEGRIWSLDASYYLANDIELTGENHVPIGSSEDPFTGTFNGNSMSIFWADVVLTAVDDLYVGLFGFTEGALIYDLKADGSITVLRDPEFGGFIMVYAGGIIGRAVSTTITNCQNAATIDIAFGDIFDYTGLFAGGIIGRAVSSTITNCHNTAAVSIDSISDSYAGGIVGQVAENDHLNFITDCTNSGDITVRTWMGSYAGGITSTLHLNEAQMMVTGCHNSGNITVEAMWQHGYAGGIVGYAGATDAQITVTDCSNSGIITSNGSGNAGGIIGCANMSSARMTIADCYNDGTIISNNHGNAGGIVGGVPEHTGSDGLVTIIRCINAGPITMGGESSHSKASLSAGGIAGRMINAIITDCYNIGQITVDATNAYVGGMAGEQTYSLTATNFYNIGQITVDATNAHVGGFLGGQSWGTGWTYITNCYFLSDDTELLIIGTGLSEYITIDGGHQKNNYPYRETFQSSGAKSSEEMRAALEDARNGNSIYYTGTVLYGKETFNGWDFDNVWTIIEGENDGYPVLRAFYASEPEGPEEPDGPGGSEGPDGPDNPEGPDGPDGPDGPENPGPENPEGPGGPDGPEEPENPGPDGRQFDSMPVFLITLAALFGLLAAGRLFMR